MCVDLNCSDRMFQVINAEIVLHFAKHEQQELWHRVIQSTADAAKGISAQGFLKLKKKDKLPPTFETRCRAAPQSTVRQISQGSPKLSSWNYTSSWGNLPIRESSCIMNWGVWLSITIQQIPLFFSRDSSTQTSQDSFHRAVNWPHADSSSLQQKLYLNEECGFKIWLNPSNLRMTPKV